MILGGATWSSFIMHQNLSPFDYVRVKKAFYLAVNHQEIMEIAFCTEKYGCFTDLGTFFTLGTVDTESVEQLASVPGWRQVGNKKDPRDIEEAKRLLAEAGYPRWVQGRHESW
jgi:ABC-type transport system substrate-binding protein